ncbi:MAG: GNAT family N-acetyltransferase [Anaerolineales bacterium]
MPITLTTPRGPITIRPAVQADAAAVRELRLQALAGEPVAFSADHDTTAAQPAETWAERIATYARDSAGVIAVAEAGGHLVGMAGLARGHWPKTRHIGEVWGVYVKPDWRGLHVGAALLDECAAWARANGIVILKLGVAKVNAPAIRCYTRCGFTVCGEDHMALCVDGVYYDELLMERVVAPSS